MWAALILIGALGYVAGKPGVNTTLHREEGVTIHRIGRVALREMQHKYLDLRPANASTMKFDWMREKNANRTHRVVPARSLTASQCPQDTTYENTGYYDSHHPYSNDIYDCIQIDVYERISIEWDDEFVVESNDQCSFDKVIITEMAGLLSEIVHPAICGTVAPAPQEFEGPLLITFQTDGSVVYHGFRLTWEVMEDAGGDYCQEVSFTSGTFETGHPYDNNEEYCVINNRGGTYTLIFDEEFDLEEDGYYDCHDFVVIIEAVGTAEEREYGPFCGTTPPHPLYNIIAPFVIEITTDGSEVRHGFRLNWIPSYSDSGSGHTPNGCTSGEIECGNGDCIPSSYVCDGYYDCDDDEENCNGSGSGSGSGHSPTGCTGHETECGDGTCIPASFLCDGYQDCNDDEEQCDGGSGSGHTPTGCASHQTECGDGSCILTSYLCDGFQDCNDDEEHCDGGSGSGHTPTGCASHQTECGDGSCILTSYLCDGFQDCNDDEEHCDGGSGHTPTGCASHQTECGDGSCILTSYLCDGFQDCNDDELNCGGSSGGGHGSGGHVGDCSTGQVQCGNGQCIPDHWWCDNFDDCDDDETQCPGN